jgi:hypothetical protein
MRALIGQRKDFTNLVAGKTIVGIPARSEVGCSSACLYGLDQQWHRPNIVVVLLNNCDDESEAIVGAIVSHLRFRVETASVVLPLGEHGAGFARRRAMALAASLATAGDALLLTTDADEVAPPNWIERNVKALAAGADVVCGGAFMDPFDAIKIPRHVHQRNAVGMRYIDLLDDLALILDPEPNDPQPATRRTGDKRVSTLSPQKGFS